MMKPLLCKTRIVPKRDFGRYGFLINGKWVKEGWIVTDGICNIMPGAIWFQTIGEAIEAAGALYMARGDATKFWNILRPQLGTAQ